MDGGVVQVAYCVSDIRAAALWWATSLGVGPFFLSEHLPLAAATSQGRPVVCDLSAAFAQWGEVQLELIEVHRAEPPAFAAAFGAERLALHHVASIVSDVDAESQRMSAIGWPCVLDGQSAAGTRFCFHDARADLGHHVEIYGATPQIQEHYDAVRRAARGWDGSRPLRDSAERWATYPV